MVSDWPSVLAVWGLQPEKPIVSVWVQRRVNDTDFGVSFFLPFKVKLAKLIGSIWHASVP